MIFLVVSLNYLEDPLNIIRIALKTRQRASRFMNSQIHQCESMIFFLLYSNLINVEMLRFKIKEISEKAVHKKRLDLYIYIYLIEKAGNILHYYNFVQVPHRKQLHASNTFIQNLCITFLSNSNFSELL